MYMPCFIMIPQAAFHCSPVLPLGAMVSSVSQLDVAARRYCLASLAASTHKTYRVAETLYLDFCEFFHHRYANIRVYFVTCLTQHGLSEGTIQIYVRSMPPPDPFQISYGFYELLSTRCHAFIKYSGELKLRGARRGLPVSLLAHYPYDFHGAALDHRPTILRFSDAEQ